MKHAVNNIYTNSYLSVIYFVMNSFFDELIELDTCEIY